MSNFSNPLSRKRVAPSPLSKGDFLLDTIICYIKYNVNYFNLIYPKILLIYSIFILSASILSSFCTYAKSYGSKTVLSLK